MSPAGRAAFALAVPAAVFTALMLGVPPAVVFVAVPNAAAAVVVSLDVLGVRPTRRTVPPA